MNERIRELAEQAYEQKPLMVLNPETFEIEHKMGNGGVAMYNRVFNQEKFAELIVRECMACSIWVGKMNNNSVEPIHTAHAINQRIKEHFGVEE